jgi:hypothetical protein
VQIEVRYFLEEETYVVGGTIDEVPFELHYLAGEADLVVLTKDFVLRTSAAYSPSDDRLNTDMTGQLIFNMARQLESEL